MDAHQRPAYYAVITGATRGLGRAIAEALWKDGASLIVCARSEAALREMESAMTPVRNDQQFFWKQTDVSDRDDLKRFAEFVHASSDVVDVLVNNAGVFIPGSVLEEEEGVLDNMMRTNLYSAYHLTRALFSLIRKSKRGHIFTMCSIASIQAYPNGGAYTIAKSGLMGFTKSLREETKPLGIKVTAVVAGATWTDSWAGADFPHDRLMEASDIAEAVMSALRMGPSAVVEQILIRPQLGDL